MNTHDIYRQADEALKFIDTIDVEQVEREDEVILAMAMNKATQLKYATFRIHELLTQFSDLYDQIIACPEKYPILEQTQQGDEDNE